MAMYFAQQNEVDRMITGETKLVGLLGNPVRHSLSPVMQNAAIKAMGLDWCYLAIPCETDDLTNIVKSLEKTNCKGLNVTIPHKQNIIHACTEITPLAKQIGAVNTLIRNESNNWTGTNTDIEGFLSPLRDEEFHNKNAVIIGAGGSSRAILAALKTLNLKKITIINRNSRNLKKFLDDSEAKDNGNNQYSTMIQGLAENDIDIIEHIKTADLIINTTPVGMNNHKRNNNLSPTMPLGNEVWNYLKPTSITYDLIYTPRPTAWLQKCIEQGCRAIDGLEMLVEQGAASLRLWSGIEDIPVETMKNAIDNHLNR